MKFHQNWYIYRSLPKNSKTWPNRWQLPTLTGVNIDRRQKLQKAIVTIEFTTLDLCRVQNFIKIEAFTAFHPKLWPERWHMATLAGVKNHKKLLSSMNSAPSNCSLSKISWKRLTSFPVPCSLFHRYLILNWDIVENRPGSARSGINHYKS